MSYSLSLLREMWPKNIIGPHAAIHILDLALESDDEQIQQEAAQILLANSERIAFSTTELPFPQKFNDKWDTEFKFNIRSVMFRSLIGALSTSPIQKWDRSIINEVILGLHAGMEKEPDPPLRRGLAYAVELLVRCAHSEMPRSRRIAATGASLESIRNDAIKYLNLGGHDAHVNNQGLQALTNLASKSDAELRDTQQAGE